MKIKFLFLILFVAININAYSQINSNNLNQTIIGPGILSFDLNNDGNNDFSFDIINLPSNGLAARVQTIGSSSILDNSTFGYPDTLNDGNLVSGYFHTGIGVLGTFHNGAQFKGAGNKYLGIKINAAGSDYLGWIKLNCSINRDTLKIISYGYNTVPAAPINAGQTSITGIHENELILKDLVRVYPNPFSSQTTLQIANSFHNATLTVDNSYGQTVKQIKNISGNSFTFLRDNLAAGLYYFRLTQDDQVIATKKIIITD